MLRRRLGYMQGRLVDQVDGKIQAFPSDDWQSEFPVAQHLNLANIEWTLDQQGLSSNPLCTQQGREEVMNLSQEYNLNVAAITGDCFMQAPFWKASIHERDQLLTDLDLVILSAAALNVKHIVVPLVDHGRLDDSDQEECFVNEMSLRSQSLEKSGIRIVIECDFVPQELARLISRLPADSFGVNYDIGNSASLGYDPGEEFDSYGKRIYHVHMKDRILGGTTVPLGEGSAQFDRVFQGLANLSYQGLFVLQTARDNQKKHADVLSRYADFTQQLMEKYFGP